MINATREADSAMSTKKAERECILHAKTKRTEQMCEHHADSNDMRQVPRDTFSGTIWCLIGKSASGKDTIYRMLLERCPQLVTIITATTRPKRSGEQDGCEYFFFSADQLDALDKKGKVIERRDYNTIYGKWSYATIDDGQISGSGDYLLIETPDGYNKLREYYGQDHVRALYIHVDDGERLQRALDRERRQDSPKYSEMCRRFLSDEQDFKQIEQQAKSYNSTRNSKIIDTLEARSDMHSMTNNQDESTVPNEWSKECLIPEFVNDDTEQCCQEIIEYLGIMQKHPAMSKCSKSKSV